MAESFVSAPSFATACLRRSIGRGTSAHSPTVRPRPHKHGRTRKNADKRRRTRTDADGRTRTNAHGRTRTNAERAATVALCVRDFPQMPCAMLRCAVLCRAALCCAVLSVPPRKLRSPSEFILCGLDFNQQKQSR